MLVPRSIISNAALDSARSYLAKVLETIEMLESELEQALKSKAAIELQIATLERPSPLPSLPNETLLQIFEVVVAQNHAPKQRDNLRLVCKMWNSFFEEGCHPTLWTDIFVPVPSKPYHIQGCVVFCFKCLAFSGSQPLRVNLDYSGCTFLLQPSDTSVEAWSRDFIIEHSSILEIPFKALQGPHGCHVVRWETFTITSPGYDLFLKPLDESFELHTWSTLEFFSMNFDHEQGFWCPAKPIEAPRLTSMRLSMLFQLGDQVRHPTLQSLELVHCHPGVLGSGVRFPKLVTLRVENLAADPLNIDEDEGEDWILPEICLDWFPSLRTLRICGRVPPDFWRNISFPQLEILHFEKPSSTEHLYVAQTAVGLFHEMPLSTFPKLKSVTIDEAFGLYELALGEDCSRNDCYHMRRLLVLPHGVLWWIALD